MRGNNTVMCEQDLVDFLMHEASVNGEVSATRFVNELTGIGIRGADKGVMELPSYMTKRKLYQKFFFGRGWVVHPDHNGNYGPSARFYNRKHDDENGDMADWPTNSQSQPICGWTAFRNIWKRRCMLIKVRPVSSDICTECFMYKNLSMFAAISRPTKNHENGLASDESENEGPYSNSLYNENLILKAAAHVEAARAQRMLATRKIEDAMVSTATRSIRGNEECVHTLIMDFCMNFQLPHLGGEQ